MYILQYGGVMKTGFTLIELLVVVLIIGILASVALPQYELAVEKSRSAEPLAVLKSIRDAQELFYLANNTYATDPSQLDIEVPSSRNWDYRINSGMSVYALRKNVDDSKKYLFAFRWAQASGAGRPAIVCGYDNAAAQPFANKLCKSFGAEEQDGSDRRWILTW